MGTRQALFTGHCWWDTPRESSAGATGFWNVRPRTQGAAPGRVLQQVRVRLRVEGGPLSGSTRRPDLSRVSLAEEVMLAEEDKNAEEKSPLDGR